LISANSLRPKGKKLLYEVVLDSIFQAIVEGKIMFGERLAEERIARDLNVSRSPVRQALQEMARQGIVALTPQMGATVNTWTVQDVEDFGRLRALTEGLAAEQAALRMDDSRLMAIGQAVDALNEAIVSNELMETIEADIEFHREIVRGSKNVSLMHAFDAMELRIGMFLVIQKYLYPSPGGRKEAYDHHCAIFEALSQRNAPLSHQRMEDHVLKASAILVDRMNHMYAEKKSLQTPPILDTILLHRRPETVRRAI
jgi:DNA-binding GntR family transcriptional regulator